MHQSFILRTAIAGLLAGSAFTAFAGAGPHSEVMYLGESDGVGVNYHVSMHFHNSDVATVATGEVLPTLDPAVTNAVGAIKSKSWNDLYWDAETVDTPITDSNGDGTLDTGDGVLDATDGMAHSYGWFHSSKWVLVELDHLRAQGYKSARVIATLLPYNDGVADEADANGNPLDDDHLVPALTAWRGICDMSPASHWYPNTFQTTEGPWWAEEIRDYGLSAASGTPMAPKASFEVNLPLSKNARMNNITLAVGGNATMEAAGHDANFMLKVQVIGSKKK